MDNTTVLEVIAQAEHDASFCSICSQPLTIMSAPSGDLWQRCASFDRPRSALVGMLRRSGLSPHTRRRLLTGSEVAGVN